MLHIEEGPWYFGIAQRVLVHDVFLKLFAERFRFGFLKKEIKTKQNWKHLYLIASFIYLSGDSE